MVGQQLVLLSFVISLVQIVPHTSARPQTENCDNTTGLCGVTPSPQSEVSELEAANLKANVALVEGKDGDGLVTLEEFKKFFRAINPNLDDDYLRKWFSKKDDDGNDRLDWTELALIGDPELLFKALDTDGNLKLTVEEFFGFNKMGGEADFIPEESLRILHQQKDKNQDGMWDIKEFDEYAKLIQTDEEKERAGAKRQIALFDENDDGVVALAEWEGIWTSLNPNVNQSLVMTKFEENDEDGNKILTWREWLGDAEGAHLVFDALDLDSNELINAEEFKRQDILEPEASRGQTDEMLFIFDKNLDGVLDLKEFIKLQELANFRPGQNIFSIIDFDLLDTDGNGQIEGKEYLKLETATFEKEDQTPQFDAYRRIALKIADLNRDGKLNRKEFNKFHDLPPPVYGDYNKFGDVFPLFDTNNDMLVDAEEAQNFWSQHRKLIVGRSDLPSVENYQQTIELYDQDGDGKLSYKEMEEMDETDTTYFAIASNVRPEHDISKFTSTTPPTSTQELTNPGRSSSSPLSQSGSFLMTSLAVLVVLHYSN